MRKYINLEEKVPIKGVGKNPVLKRERKS